MAKGKGFLDLDMRLVRDIVYLFGEVVGEYGSLHTKDLIWILGKKGYGRNKVRHALGVMQESRLLIRFSGSRNGKRYWSWRLSGNWCYVGDFFKSVLVWKEAGVRFKDIRLEHFIRRENDRK